MKDIDNWFADQCGVETYDDFGVPYPEYYFIKDGREFQYLWTIHDPRCREVIREKFWLCTNRAGNSTALMDGKYWICSSSNNQIRRIIKIGLRGKTIAEAEIACCEAIYEAQK